MSTALVPAVEPMLGDYVILSDGTAGQVMALSSAGTYSIRRAGTEVEELMSKSDIIRVLTIKSQKVG